jgi:hypothetical protein
MVSDQFDMYATWVAERLAAGVILSPGEQRFVKVIEAMGESYRFWRCERMNNLAAE